MVGSKACLCIGKALYAPTILRCFSYPSGIGVSASTLPHHYVDGMSIGYGFGVGRLSVVLPYLDLPSPTDFPFRLDWSLFGRPGCLFVLTRCYQGQLLVRRYSAW